MIKKGRFFNAIISAFGVSVLSQLLGLVRQILIAAYFGVSRSLDIYFMAYAIATLTVFAFGVIFDSVSVPHLVKTMESRGYDVFKKLTGSIFTFSILFTLLLSAIFILATPVASRFVTVGFSETDRVAIQRIAYFFLPWTAISMPYFALCSFFKSIRRFNIVFAGEVVISSVSLIFIFFFHAGTNLLPIAYFAGYLSAFIMLFTVSFRYFNRMGNIFTEEMKKIYRNFAELFGANQVGSLSSIVERFLQSFLPSGGISVLSYSSQITTNAGGLLSFRDIFLVPLSSVSKRAEKLERAVIGLSLITLPIMIFSSVYAKDIVGILFRRGKFDGGAVEITAQALSIYILALMPSVVGVPAFRMFQVIDRIKSTAAIYLFSLLNFAIFGSVSTFYFKYGILGLAGTVVLNAYLVNVFTFYLLKRYGISIDMLRLLKYVSYSAASSLLIIFIIRSMPFESLPIVKFLISGSIYLVLVSAAHLPIINRMRSIVYGDEDIR